MVSSKKKISSMPTALFFHLVAATLQKVLDREIDSVDGLDKDDDDNDDDNDGKLVHTEGLGRLPLMMAAPSGGQ